MTAPDPIYVTNSELGTVRRCEKRWEFAYRDLLTPAASARPLTVGAAVHEGIAALYRYVQQQQRMLGGMWAWGDTDHNEAMAQARNAMDAELARRHERLMGVQFDVSDDEWWQEAAEATAEATAALHLFVDQVLLMDVHRYDVLAVEQPFEIPLPNEQGNGRSRVFVRGRLDLVLRERATGRVCLGEHKTTKGYAHEADFRLDVDPQPRTYAYALRELYGVEHTGRSPTLLLNVVRKSRPSVPQAKQDGMISTAAIDTLRSIYEQACAEQPVPAWLVEARLAFASAEASLSDAMHDRTDGDISKLERELVKADERLTKRKERHEKVLAKQRQLAEQLPASMARWAHRAEYLIEADSIEQWRLDVHSTVRHQLRDLVAGRRRAVRNGAVCIGPASGCPYRIVCVDEDAPERQSLYALRVHRHAEALDDPEAALDAVPPRA